MIERKQKTLQIIVLNTNLFVGKNKNSEERTKKMWDWLDLSLRKCKENQQMVSKKIQQILNKKERSFCNCYFGGSARFIYLSIKHLDATVSHLCEK